MPPIHHAKPLTKHLAKQLANTLLARGGQTVMRAPLYPVDLVFETIPGWFSAYDALGLWTAATLANGDFLEIGHYCGRSTSLICQRIQLLGGVNRFVSYDLSHLSQAELQRHFAALNPTGTTTLPPDLIALYAAGRTTTDVARAHLTQHGLADYVTLIGGDFREDTSTYDFIFCDAAHHAEEIAANIPHCQRLLRPTGILAVHDVTAPLVAAYQQYGFALCVTIGTVGIFRLSAKNKAP